MPSKYQHKTKEASTEFFLLLFCSMLLEKTKHDPELHKAAKKKVQKEISENSKTFKDHQKIRSN